MTTISISIDLPEERLSDAEEFGVLKADVIAALIAAELDQRIMAMVNEEIHQYRTEKASSRQHDDDHTSCI